MSDRDKKKGLPQKIDENPLKELCRRILLFPGTTLSAGFLRTIRKISTQNALECFEKLQSLGLARLFEYKPPSGPKFVVLQ